MRYPLVKVLLTVSPFRPSFSPQLNPYPRAPRLLSPLSTAFTPNRTLTPLSTAFTQTHRGVGVLCPCSPLLATRHSPLATFIRPLFSQPYESLFSQLFCFHNHLRCPLVFSPRRISPRFTHKTRPRLTIFRMNTCKSVSKQTTLTTFRMNTYAKAGGRGVPQSTNKSVGLKLCLPRAKPYSVACFGRGDRKRVTGFLQDVTWGLWAPTSQENRLAFTSREGEGLRPRQAIPTAGAKALRALGSPRPRTPARHRGCCSPRDYLYLHCRPPAIGTCRLRLVHHQPA